MSLVDGHPQTLLPWKTAHPLTSGSRSPHNAGEGKMLYLPPTPGVAGQATRAIIGGGCGEDRCEMDRLHQVDVRNVARVVAVLDLIK